jgi:hypothetical protein
MTEKRARCTDRDVIPAKAGIPGSRLHSTQRVRHLVDSNERFQAARQAAPARVD